MQTQTAIAATVDSASAAEPLFQRIWPPATLAIGLGLTVAWTGILVYGLAKLMERAF
jgi:hypothetical protein